MKNGIKILFEGQRATGGISMDISLLQFAPVWEDRSATRKKIESLLADVTVGRWLVLPEMALSGFSMDRGKTEWDDADYAFFSAMARERACYITVGGAREGRNTAFVFAPEGTVVASYAKRHLFSYAGEDARYEAGIHPVQYAVDALKVGQAICYDLRFPYGFWAEAPEVDAYCVIAAWGARRTGHWSALLKARAVENQAFVIGVNRVGEEPGVQYAGGSAIIDPQGNAILECSTAEGCFSAAIDISAVESWRKAFPAIKDRLQ